MSGFRPRFFVTAADVAGSADIAGSAVTLDADDSHHVVRVLRLRPGDECEVVVGAAVYAATVLSAAPGGRDKAVQLSLGARLEWPEAGASYRHPVTLVQALPRPAVIDWSIEKSTETGVSLILLVQAAGSPRPAGKDAAARHARYARIAREAAKQSKQPAVPEIETVASLAEAVRRMRDAGYRSVVLDPGAERTLYEVVAEWAGAGMVAGRDAPGAGPAPPEAATPGGVAVWVGPESGWTDGERDELLQAGLIGARLGHGVLRTETAGPVAVAVARLALGDW